jgi:GT2 family glycosyltransferase
MDISVIVVSYNTEELTRKTLDAIQDSFELTPELSYELIVVDNGSRDGSVEMINGYRPSSKSCNYIPIISNENLGFGGGNNLGIRKATGTYVLLLNSDVIADKVNFKELIEYMDSNGDVGGLTVRVELPDGHIDPASHRGFPTPWRSFCYFTKLQHLTYPIPFLRKTFGGYHLLDKNPHEIHEIDSPTAAFFLIRGTLLRKLHGFDEDYFMYGEDLDLSMRMHNEGKKIIYYPRYTVIHLKHQSGLKTNRQHTKSTTTYHFYNAMKIFYDKHYAARSPKLFRWLIHKAIDVKYYLASGQAL